MRRRACRSRYDLRIAVLYRGYDRKNYSPNPPMNDIRPEKSEDIVCRCSGTTRERIQRLIAAGVNDLDGISRRTGACSGCGACDTLIMELIAETIDGAVLAGSPALKPP